MPEKQDIQLLPETKRRMSVRVPGENKFLIAGAAFLALMLMASYFVSSYATSQENKLQEMDVKLETLEKSRYRNEEKKLLVLAKQVGNVAEILRKHTYWGTALAHLESIIQDQVQIRSLKISYAPLTTSFQMPALGLSYIAVARQLASFQADNAINESKISGVSLKNGFAEFNAEFSADSEKFFKFKE